MRNTLFIAISFLWTTDCFGQDFTKLTIDPSRQFKIQHEDSVYNYFDEFIKISSDVWWVTDSKFKQMNEIKFTEAELKGDTLDIEIFETNTVYDYRYRIKVVDGEFNINFWYQTTIDTAVRQIRTAEQVLFLDKKEFKKGQVVRGHTEYKGQCIKGCAKAEMEPIYIRGNFKVTVK